MAAEDNDLLALRDNEDVAKMLKKHGEEAAKETVLFSALVGKINRKDKEQQRVLMITDRALYNLMPSSYGKCKRRIEIRHVFGLTMSRVSEEFVVHVPSEYDYRFKSASASIISQILARQYKKLRKESGGVSDDDEMRGPPELWMNEVDKADLKEETVTRVQARQMARQQELIERRKQMFMGEASEAEKEEMESEAHDEITDMMDTSHNVTLDDFELLRVLGRGSFGKVMLVRHKKTNVIHAMKILKKRAIIKRNQVEHTRAERDILQSLQHPFLMNLRYAFQNKEKLYFVLDYISGGELFFHLKTVRRFEEKTAKIFVAEIALALGHLHSKNIVYRDLKPENILLDPEGHVCLTDFGLSKEMDPDEAAHTFCGTPEYLAPEIVANLGHDKAVDWWALGILLYELTVGIPPFYSQKVKEMYEKIRRGVLRFPNFLSENCRKVIVALLNRDPSKRLGSANDIDEIMAHPFFADLDRTKLLAKEYDPGFKPKVKSATDVSNFDTTFTKERAIDSVIPDSELGQTLAEAGSAFDGFTFKADNALEE